MIIWRGTVLKCTTEYLGFSLKIEKIDLGFKASAKRRDFSIMSIERTMDEARRWIEQEVRDKEAISKFINQDIPF